MEKRPSGRKKHINDAQNEHGQKENGKMLGDEPVWPDNRDGIKNHDNVHTHIKEANPGLQQKVGHFVNGHAYISQDYEQSHESTQEGSQGQHTAGTVVSFSL
jgi:hypothetical protein